MKTDLIATLRAMGMDTEGGLRRFCGNEELYVRFLLKFADDESCAQALAAKAQEDWDGLFTAAHTLKGVSGNLGLTGLYEASAAVVAHLRANDHTAAAAACDEMERAYEAVLSPLTAAAKEAAL